MLRKSYIFCQLKFPAVGANISKFSATPYFEFPWTSFVEGVASSGDGKHNS